MKHLSVFDGARDFLLDTLPLFPQYAIKSVLNGLLTLGLIQSFRIVKRNMFK